MPLEIKLCESTDLAMTIFNMFRLNTVNVVEPVLSENMDSTPIQYRPSTAEEYASSISLYDVHQRLFAALCKKVLVYDLVRHDNGLGEHRQVDFWLDLGLIEISFTVWVDRVRPQVDRTHDKRSEWNKWRFKRAEFVQMNVPEGDDYCFWVSHHDNVESFTPTGNDNYPAGAVFNLSEQQRTVFGRMVCSKVMD